MRDPAIVVVEQDAQERERLLRALGACGPPDTVLGVAGCGQALAHLHGAAEHPGRGPRKLPRLLLVGLPGAGASALLDAVRSDPRTRSVPVVLLVAPGAPRTEQDAWYKAGANSLVGKTSDDEELARKMRRVHDFWMTVNEADRQSRV